MTRQVVRRRPVRPVWSVRSRVLSVPPVWSVWSVRSMWSVRYPVLPAVLVLLCAVMLAACSGIPESGRVQDVRKVVDLANQQAPVTPDPGMAPDAIARGFVYAAARITLSGTTPAYAAPSQYLTAKAAQTWQTKPASVVILSDQFRIDPTANPAEWTIRAPIQGTLDPDRAYHPGGGALYTVNVHLVKENGQWRLSDPPAELLIRQSDFDTVFSVRTLYFLDAGHSVVVPDRRYIIRGGAAVDRVVTLVNLLLRGPAGVLKGAADSELTGGRLRTKPTTDSTGVTVVDLKGIDLPTAADQNALAAQLVWTLSPDAGQVSINVNGVPLDAKQLVYRASTVASFSPDRVPGGGELASDAYFVDQAGSVLDLRTKKPLIGAFGVGSVRILYGAMSAATRTLAAVATVRNTDGSTSQQLLIGQPSAYDEPVPALKATTLTQPSFSRSGDEAWVVQNGNGRTPEIYQVSTSRTSTTGGGAGGTGTASRAKVGSADLTGKGAVTALLLSPDGVRVAIVAGGKLYLGAIATPDADAPTGTSVANPAEGPDALTVTNLRELRTDLTNVGPVAFQSAEKLMVVSSNVPGYRSIKQLNVDGSGLTQVTTDSQFGDVTSMAISVVDSTAEVPGEDVQATGTLFVTVGQPGTVGPVLELRGSLTDGSWQPADATAPVASSLFFPN